MLLAALVYSLLAMKVRIHTGASLFGLHGSFFMQADVLFFHLRHDAEIHLDGKARRSKLIGRYGRRQERTLSGMRAGWGRALRPYLMAALRSGRVERMNAYMRLGLSDAFGTAMMAGGVRAAAAAVLACIGLPCALRVEADYRAPCFCLTADCIFCICPGDIVFALIKTAAERRRKRDPNGKASH